MTPKRQFFFKTVQKVHLFEATRRQNDNFWSKLFKNAPFLSSLAKQVFGQIFSQGFGQTEQQQQQHTLQQQREARAKRAPPFMVSVPAVALFLNLTKILTKNLTKHLTKLLTKKLTLLRQAASKRLIFEQF